MALTGTAFLLTAPSPELPLSGSGALDVNVTNQLTTPLDVNVVSGADVEVFEVDIPNGAPNTTVSSIDVSGFSTLTVQVTGTWSGDIQLAAFLDPAEGGPSFKLFNYATGAPVSVISGSDGTNQFFVGPTSGITSLGFARAANWVSGSAHIYVRASKLPSPYSRIVNTTAQAIPINDAGGSLTVDGTVSVSGTVTVAAHAVTDGGGSLTVDGTVGVNNFPATQPVSGTVAVSNLPTTQPVSLAAAVPVTDNGGSLTVDGTVGISGTVPVSGNVGITGTPAVSVSNLPATQPVSGTVAVSNLPTTQPVSGTVAISGTPTVGVNNFPATQPVSGTVAVSNFPATQPVSGTVAVSGTPTVSVSNLPATQPVSGTVAVSNFPATQPVSGTVAVSGTPMVSVSNFPATQPVSGTVTVSNPGGTVVGTTDNTTGTALVGEALMAYDTVNSVYRRATASIRGSSNEKMALDVASTSSLQTITVTAGSGTRNFGPIDTLNYVWWTGYFTALGSANGSMVLQGSNDNVNWFPLVFEYQTGSGSNWTTAVGSALGNSIASSLIATATGALYFRYMRIQTTATVTGTYTFQVAVTPSAITKNNLALANNSNIGNADAQGVTSLGAINAMATYPWIYAPTGVAITWDRLRTATTFKTALITATGSTALWTPTSGKKFRLMRYKIDVPTSTIAASPADLTITFLDSATATNVTETITVPSTATGGIGAWTSGWVDLGNGIVSAAANNVLNANLSFALTAGGARITCCGTEE